MSIEPLCGREWLDKHKYDHTQAEVDALGMEIITPAGKTTVKAGTSKKGLKVIINQKILNKEVNHDEDNQD
jgi:hypothetical protein